MTAIQYIALIYRGDSTGDDINKSCILETQTRGFHFVPDPEVKFLHGIMLHATPRRIINRVDMCTSSLSSERPVDRDVDQVRGRAVLGEERDLLEVVEHRRELLRARRCPHELADRSVQREIGRVRERDIGLRK